MKLPMCLQSRSWPRLSPCGKGIQRSVQGQKSRRWYEIERRASLAMIPRVAVMSLFHALALLADTACLQSPRDQTLSKVVRVRSGV